MASIFKNIARALGMAAASFVKKAPAAIGVVIITTAVVANTRTAYRVKGRNKTGGNSDVLFSNERDAREFARRYLIPSGYGPHEGPRIRVTHYHDGSKSWSTTEEVGDDVAIGTQHFHDGSRSWTTSVEQSTTYGYGPGYTIKPTAVTDPDIRIYHSVFDWENRYYRH
jgi:hypothetical protein